eukprot:GHVU01117304.1.p4 GENE.GHVU01117304.1~~GHVU01117304.1.p4  ORF type:complete len:105 (+),score=8.85 GHVU01117304.1:1612-1926(+)
MTPRSRARQGCGLLEECRIDWVAGGGPMKRGYRTRFHALLSPQRLRRSESLRHQLGRGHRRDVQSHSEVLKPPRHRSVTPQQECLVDRGPKFVLFSHEDGHASF